MPSTDQKPQFTEWMRSLRAKTQQVVENEEEERRWQEQYGK